MGRAPCCDKATVKKGPWSPEEDAKLKAYMEEHGAGGNWIALPQKIGLKRCGKSCRLRWLNYLRPNIKHGAFSEEEDRVICSLYISIGSRWSIIAAQLPGRTDNDIKNYWNTKLKKKLLGKQRDLMQLSSDSAFGIDQRQDLHTLSPSAIERIQLHMQLRGLNHPFYDVNPLLWPNAHQLDDKTLEPQSCDAISNTTTTTTTTTSVHQSSFDGTGTEASNKDSAEILLSKDSNLYTLEAELHELLYAEKSCFEGDEISNMSELAWSEQLPESGWAYASHLQQQATIQEYVLPYDL